MATQYATIVVRRGNAESWADSTRPLEPGEWGYDDTSRVTKIGDGFSLWSELPIHLTATADGNLPSDVRARLAENLADPETPEGAVVSSTVGKQGPPGEPGNNIPTDTAVAGYLGDPASQSGALAASRFASQLTATSATSVAQINSWLAAGSALGAKRLVGAVTITSAPIVVPSGTYLDATGATITSTFVGNMLQNANAKSTTSRDKDITIVGGTWQRNAGGPAATAEDGSANGAHSLFLRHIDRLRIRGLSVGSTGGKYMIALGDVTNFHVSEIAGTTLASDTVHITGPAKNGLVELVEVSSGGDDVVATTTTDYAAYSDTHGDITDVTIRGIKGGNTTRIVLIAGASYATGQGDGHVLDRIVVDTVTQTGTGAVVWTGAGGSTDVLGSIEIAHVYGGPIQLRHPNHRVVVVRDAPRGVIPATQDTNTVVNIGRLILRDTTVASGNFLLLNNAGIVIDHLEIDNVTSTADSLINHVLGVVKKAVLSSVRYAGTNNMLAIAGTLTALVFNGVTAVMNVSTTHVIRVNAGGVIGSATFNDVDVTGVDTNTATLVNQVSSATVGAVVVNRGTFTTFARFLEKASGATGAVLLRLTDVTVAGANRLAQVGGGTVDFAYSNIRLSGVANQPVRLYGGATGKISGNGWAGYTGGALVTDVAAAVQCTALDFPVDLSLLSKANGDRATNTNNALACGLGPAVSNGTNWKNLYTGTTY